MAFFDFWQAVRSMRDKDTFILEIHDDRFSEVLGKLKDAGISIKRPQCRGEMTYVDVPNDRHDDVKRIIEGK